MNGKNAQFINLDSNAYLNFVVLLPDIVAIIGSCGWQSLYQRHKTAAAASSW
jgi:hypothetical protein